MSLFSEKELSTGHTIKLRPPPQSAGRKKPRQTAQGAWKERAEELEKQGMNAPIYFIHSTIYVLMGDFQRWHRRSRNFDPVI